MPPTDDVSSNALDSLESRLRRVAYALTGDGSVASEPQPQSNNRDTASARVRGLDRQLQSLATRSQAVSDVLRLHSAQPHLFHPATTSTSLTNTSPPAVFAALVLSHGLLYERTASQLGILKDQSVPDPAIIVPLVELRARIENAAAKQAQQVSQVAELRANSAQTLEWWFARGVLDMSERWSDWEERMRDVEILVRRMDALRRREEGMT